MKRYSRVIVVMAALNLSGCAGWFNAKHEDEKVTSAPPAKVETRMVAREVPPVKRELGSIWNDNSSWNVLYSPPLQRMVGDVVILKPTDNFRFTVASRTSGGASWDSVQGNNRESSQIVAVIKEILPRQVYRVEAKQAVKVGVKDHEIELHAKIREQDIGNDDSGSTDSIFDMELAVKGEPAPDLAKAQGANSARGLASVPGAKVADGKNNESKDKRE